MKKIVIIGGGSGLATMMRGFKHLKNVQLSAIVTVADDGGSTGRLRRQFHLPAMGDIRNVMVAMAKNESILSDLMAYRFDENAGDIAGHNLGNLMLTALTQSSGSFIEAISTLSKVLNVKGEILPSTLQSVNLFARMQDGTIVMGESNIPNIYQKIDEVFYNEKVIAYSFAIKAIIEADYIVYGIGSLYTSIIPNLIIPEIVEAIKKSKAKKIYFCNAMTQYKETTNYTLEDHVDALLKHSYSKAIDIVIHHNNVIYPKRLIDYEKEHSFPVQVANKKHDYQLYFEDLLSFDDHYIRHDSQKLKDVMQKIIQGEL